MIARLVRLRWLPGFVAITLGSHVYIRRQWWASASRERRVYLLRHEAAHVLQWWRYGPVFPIVYVWGWMRAGFRYSRNWFEREARQAERRTESADLFWLQVTEKPLLPELIDYLVKRSGLQP